MRAENLIIASLLLATPYVHAAEPDACATALNSLPADTLLPESASSDETTIEFEVGALEAQFGANPTAHMTGGIMLRRGDKHAGAESADYDPTSRSLLLEGNVRYQDRGTQIDSDLAEFAYGTGSVRFEGAEFSLGSSNARGAAEALRISEEGTLQLDGVSYTTCPPGSNDWLIEAKDIDLDTRDGVGVAKGMKLRFQGIPILYAPYLSFPIGDARKSGLLAPEVGTTQRGGNEIRMPYYFNLAPNYDATVTPHLMSDRGLQLQTEFRYLTESMNGNVRAEYLGSDNRYNDTSCFSGPATQDVF